MMQGCWNYKEIDSMNIVAGFAIDRGYEGYKYHLTIDIADTSRAGKDKPVQTDLVESEGDTIMDAIRNTMKRTGMKLYFPNCQIAIISRDVAQDSILPVLDFLMRDAEPRLTMELLISEEKTAKEVLQQAPTTMSITSFEIDKMYELSEKYQPATIYQVLYQNYNTLADEGRALTMASVRLSDNNGAKTAVLNGTAIFNKDKLAGFLTTEDSKYCLFVMDGVTAGVIDVKAPTGNTVAALEVFGNKTTVTPIVENGKIRFTIHTETDAALDELDETADVLDKDNLHAFETLAEKQLQENIARVIGMVQQQYGLDIFGFCDALHRSDLQTWRQVQQNWDSVFKNMQVDVSCKINIRNGASEKGPAKIGNRP
jgi:spore germination protein KC